MAIKLSYQEKQEENMIKLTLYLKMLFFLNLFNSCANDRIARASKAGIDIVVISKESRYFVVIQPKDDFDGNFENENYLEIGIAGGIVPVNHLILYNDPETEKIWVGYSIKVFQKHLNSSFVFFENDNEICFDSKTFTSRNCIDFDIFLVLYGTSR